MDARLDPMKPRTITIKLLIILFLSFTPISSWANDSFATAAAGGIYLIQNDKVAILKEELHIHPDHINVQYQFENQSDEDITNLVAFPLPSIVPFELGRDLNIEEMKNPGNPLKFQLWVNGKKTKFSHEIRAFLKTKNTAFVDVTPNLIQFQIPYQQPEEKILFAFQKLSSKQKSHLLKKGIFALEQGQVVPRFTLHPIFYWKQHFPAHQIVTIKHRYKPSSGGSMGFPDEEKFCIDSPTNNRMNHIEFQGYSYLDYILTTGANWNGPIRSFHLILEKKTPSEIISLCLPGLQLKKTSRTTFEAWATNFTPRNDLSILFIDPEMTTPFENSK